MGITRDQLKDKRIAIIGAGGVARAAAGGLLDAGAKVVIFNRTAARAQRLAEELAGVAEADSARLAVGKPDSISCGCFHAFINCTPIGMQGGLAPDESPLPDDVPLNDEVTVMDTVYAPVRTPLIREAESRGARVITGVDMFLRQAAMQFEMWTGRPAPMAAFRAALVT